MTGTSGASARGYTIRTGGSRVRPVFDHLRAMTDVQGLFEHALLDSPRPEHGYCVDDVARGLVVTCREPRPDRRVVGLRDQYLDFVLGALDPDGTCHNRLDIDGRWLDDAGLGDWWGRAVWALGVAAAQPAGGAGQPGSGAGQARALAGFRIAAQQRSPFGRSMAFAALGAAEVLRVRPTELSARDLVRDTVAVVDQPGAPGVTADWPWPEPRLRYANGTVAEAVLVSGEVLDDKPMMVRGLTLIAFLLRVETRDGHLSVAPVGGRGPGDKECGFDQQPIEVAAIADACATAYRITADPRWLAGLSLAWRWFLGDNDSRTPMFDPSTGAGYDGLECDGCNLNRGAESTLAMLSTAQHARRVQELQ